MCELLGASIEGENMKPYFIEPEYKHKIHIIFDPSHAIKLVRNNLASHGIIYDSEGGEIKWQYIEKLHKIGKNNGFSLSHKLTNDHINFANRKMSVRYAVQTLSRSVADSMQYLMDNDIGGFSAAGPTIKFIRMFNDIFDILNTQRIMHDQPNQLKSAINFQNHVEVFSTMLKVKEYIHGLRCKSHNDKIFPILESRIKTGFRGFVIDIVSVMNMYREYIEDHGLMNMLATYRMSQDHLEMYFHRIRSIHRCNDNPTIQQFVASYKRVQLISAIGEILPSAYANVSCLPAINILNIPSTRPEQHNDEILNDSNNAVDNGEDEASLLVGLEEIQRGNVLLDMCSNTGVAFLAYKIEQTILNCGQIYCSLCEKAILYNEKVDRRDCIGKNIPCRSTYQICKAADNGIKQFIACANKDFNIRVINYVLGCIDLNNLYLRHFEGDHDLTHKHYLIRYVINTYIQKKCTYLAKQKNYEMHKQYLRNIHRKAVHFAGQ